MATFANGPGTQPRIRRRAFGLSRRNDYSACSGRLCAPGEPVFIFNPLLPCAMRPPIKPLLWALLGSLLGQGLSWWLKLHRPDLVSLARVGIVVSALLGLWLTVRVLNRLSRQARPAPMD